MNAAELVVERRVWSKPEDSPGREAAFFWRILTTGTPAETQPTPEHTFQFGQPEAIVQLVSALYLSVLIFGGARLAQQFRQRRRLSAGATGGVGALFIGFGAKLASATLN